MLTDVCQDATCNGLWRFDAGKQTYARVHPDGSVTGVIAGKFLPDPEILWRNRCDQLDVAQNSDIGSKLNPTEATFKLWKHWQEVQNAN